MCLLHGQALSAGPAAEPTEVQKRLQKRAEDDLQKKRRGHQKMILPASTALKERYEEEVEDLQEKQPSSYLLMSRRSERSPGEVEEDLQEKWKISRRSGRSEKDWAQQLSFDVQKKAGRHVTVSDTQWVARRAEREIIAGAFEGATVYETATAMLQDAGDGKRKQPHST